MLDAFVEACRCVQMRAYRPQVQIRTRYAAGYTAPRGPGLLISWSLHLSLPQITIIPTGPRLSWQIDICAAGAPPCCPWGSSPTRRCHGGLAPLMCPAFPALTCSPRACAAHEDQLHRFATRPWHHLGLHLSALLLRVVIVHAPKGLSTLAAAARATSTGASSSADGASEAAYSTAALAAAS